MNHSDLNQIRTNDLLRKVLAYYGEMLRVENPPRLDTEKVQLVHVVNPNEQPPAGNELPTLDWLFVRTAEHNFPRGSSFSLLPLTEGTELYSHYGRLVDQTLLGAGEYNIYATTMAIAFGAIASNNLDIQANGILSDDTIPLGISQGASNVRGSYAGVWPQSMQPQIVLRKNASSTERWQVTISGYVLQEHINGGHK